MHDHLGRPVSLEGPPARVVSLVPSITESVVELGFGRALVGRTRFCPEVPGVPALGGTKNPDLSGIRALQPDLVLANQEENRESDVESLERVFVTDVRSVAAALDWVEELAALLGGVERARGDRAPVPAPSGPRAATLVWKQPLVAVGEDTYAADVLRACGLSNVFSGRYPRIALDDILEAELVVLPTEPYPWTAREARELEAELAARGAKARAVLVPGEALTWWGTRTRRGLDAVRKALDEGR